MEDVQSAVEHSNAPHESTNAALLKYIALSLTLVVVISGAKLFLLSTVRSKGAKNSQVTPKAGSSAASFAIPFFNLMFSGSPQSGNVEVRLPMKHFVLFELTVPLLGLLFAYIISVFDNFEDVVAVNCGPEVKNFIPSISSCIGDFAPQRYIWRLAVALFVPFRVLDGLAVNANLQNDIRKSWAFSNLSKSRSCLSTFFLNLHLLCVWVEYSSLYVLTYVSSADNLLLHIVGFSFFMMFSSLYQISTLITGLLIGYHRPGNSNQRCWKFKFGWFVTNVTCAVSAAVMFFVHRAYCVSGVYSIFSLFEWSFVFSNIFFHAVEVSELITFSISMESSSDSYLALPVFADSPLDDKLH